MSAAPPLEEFRRLVLEHLEAMLAAVRNGEWTIEDRTITRCPHCDAALTSLPEKWRLKAGTVRDKGDVTVERSEGNEKWWGTFYPSFGRWLDVPKPEADTDA